MSILVDLPPEILEEILIWLPNPNRFLLNLVHPHFWYIKTKRSHRFDFVEYCLENDYDTIIDYAIDHLKLSGMYIKQLIECSIGHRAPFSCTKSLVRRGMFDDFSMRYVVANVAAYHGDTKYLSYLHEHGFGWSIFVCNYACKGGNIQCLKYLHEHGAIIYQGTVKHAIDRDFIDCFRYITENTVYDGIDYDNICDAISNNSIRCLKHIIENIERKRFVPIRLFKLTENFKENDHNRESLRYARSHGFS